MSADELFSEIYGHEDVKELFALSLKSPKPIHILMQGPPASGKTLFMLALERLPLRVKYYLGGQTSKAGLTEILLREKPDILLIDEIDKMNGRDYDSLLSVMETGRVVRCKYRLWAEEQLATKVYGACNTTNGIPEELLSRFLLVEFKPYSRQEFIDVSKHILRHREGLTEQEAETIARLLADTTRNVRDAIKLARLYRAGGDPEKLARTFFRKKNAQQTLLL
ncbi:MAG: AAA family ATPase [Candidatus Jordarchaeales archaeon]|nr:AAA family ATPase [Candidatus Jordarchaeia archaeon]